MYNLCKGRACALHLTPEYDEGQLAKARSQNPYDFFDEYEKHYAFCIGNQTVAPISGKKVVNGVTMFTGVLR